jgi:hypothetical protein
LNVFVISQAGDLWEMSSTDDGATRSWTNRGQPSNVALDGASVASWGPGRYDVFTRDKNTGVMWQWYRDPSGNTHWWSWGTPPGTTVAFTPEVMASGDQSLKIFVTGADQAVYMRMWDHGDKGWTRLDPWLKAGVGAVRRSGIVP